MTKSQHIFLVYTKHMQFPSKLSFASEKRSHVASCLSLYLVGFFVVSSLTQLVSFENLVVLFEKNSLLFISSNAAIAAALIVICEVFALPFLLKMKISRLMWWVSMSAGLISLLGWLLFCCYFSFFDHDMTNLGIFGAQIITPSGFWSVSFLVALLCFFAFVVFDSARSTGFKKYSKK